MKATTSDNLGRVDSDLQYRAAVQKADSIRSELARIEREIRSFAENKEADVDRAVQAVLAGGTGDIVEQPQLEALHRRRRVLAKALSVAEQAAANERRRVTGDLCKALEPEAAKLAEQTCRSLLGLFDALAAERTYFAGLKLKYGLLGSDLPPAWQCEPNLWRHLCGGATDGSHPLSNGNNLVNQIVSWYSQWRGVRAADIAARIARPGR